MINENSKTDYLDSINKLLIFTKNNINPSLLPIIFRFGSPEIDDFNDKKLDITASVICKLSGILLRNH